jgi:ADP-ribose pyrophosphatase YjhB (NUDIX family)
MKTCLAIGGIIRNEEGKVLMLDHKKTGLWTIPVGKVEECEHITDALIREMIEELSIQVKGFISVKDIKHPWSGGDFRTYIFNITSYTGEIRNNEPHKHPAMKWMAIEEIERLDTTYATQGALEYLKEHERFKQRIEMITK